jgi:signal transduction histidine kinase
LLFQQHLIIVPMTKRIIFLIFLFLTSITSSFAQSVEEWKLTLRNEVEQKTAKETRGIYTKEGIGNSKALAYANLLLEKSRAAYQDQTIFRVCRDIGLIHEDSNQLTEALGFYNEAEQVAKVLSDTARVTIYIDLAIVQRKLCNYVLCKDYYLKVIDIAPRIQDTESMECAYHGLGSLYQSTGDYERSVAYFLRSLEVAEQRKSTEGMAMSLQNIAKSMLLAKNTERALLNIERAYSLALQTNDPQLIGIISKDYGEVLEQNNNISGALEKYEAALKYFGTDDYKPYVVKIWMNMANAHIQQGNYDKAEHYLLQCLNEYRPFIFNEDLGSLYLKIGNLYDRKQNKQQAALAYRKGIDVCDKFQLKETCAKIARALSVIEEENGHQNVALALLKKANALEADLFSDERTKHTAELQFKFDAAKGEKEIQDLKLSQNKIIITALGLGLALLLAAFFLWYRIKNRSTKALRLKNAEVKEQNRLLEESNDVLREFAYASAHDLKEPLRNIGSFITLLQHRYGKTFNEEANEYMGFVKAGVIKMNKLLEDLLDYSTLVVDKQDEEKTVYTTQLHEILEEVQANLKNTIDTKKVTIAYNTSLPVLKMSRLHQTQLFQNLISNAIKFSEETPVINIKYEDKNEKCLVSVSDNGIGIKTEYSAKVFKLFHRLSRDTRYEGTGVGLSICKSIVEKYHGKIWFESKEQQGTTFFIEIPKAA